MNKLVRISILTMLTITALFFAAVFSYGDTVPYYSGYTSCDIYVNGSRISQTATLQLGNVYIDIDTLRTYGDTSGWTFGDNIKIDLSHEDVVFGDEETTEFIKRNAGIVEIRLHYFNTYYDTAYRYYVSLGEIAGLARLEWTYKDGAVYIVPYADFSGQFMLASGTEDTFISESGDEKADALKENQLLNVISIGTERVRVSDTAGNTFFVPASQANILSDSSLVHSYSRRFKQKDVFDGPINAMWSDLSYCPDKIDGLDVLADISFYPWANDSGSAYSPCVNVANYGLIQSAKARGYKWWLCAQNFNTSMGATYDYIDPLLRDRASANGVIAKYLFYTCILDADGINIDYEEMDQSSRNYFISFMQTLGKHADKLGITTSVCTYCGTVWNNATIYPYDILGQCCDFICEMVYNEDISSSLSPMSRPYYIAGTDYIGSLAPHSRILMGVADYTRYTYWSGGYLEGSIWLTLNGVWGDREGMTMSWDEYTGQYYAEQPYVRSGVQYLAKFYVEEGRSSALKAQYIVDNGYGGTIGWMFNYMSPAYPEVKAIYDAYYGVYRLGLSYNDFI